MARRKYQKYSVAPVKYLVLDNDEDDVGGAPGGEVFSLLTEQDKLDEDEDEVVI
jgi:hypothetical protein